jgi:two-component system CheB/CheR fusion protein
VLLFNNRLETVSLATPEAASCPQEFSIVGIGASAGGLEACSALLKNIPSDTGLAL